MPNLDFITAVNVRTVGQEYAGFRRILAESASSEARKLGAGPLRIGTSSGRALTHLTMVSVRTRMPGSIAGREGRNVQFASMYSNSISRFLAVSLSDQSSRTFD